MPNELGLLSKQEAKAVRDLNLTANGDLIREIAEIIKSAQQLSYTQTEVQFNRVMTNAQFTDVEKYYKNTMGYTVASTTTGVPAGNTKLISINWV